MRTCSMLLPLVVSAMISSCTSSGLVCPAILTAAVAVTVRDQQTQADITVLATLSATNGAGQAIQVYTAGQVQGTKPIFIYGGGGVYNLRVSAPGYADVSLRVDVPIENECNLPGAPTAVTIALPRS